MCFIRCHKGFTQTSLLSPQLHGVFPSVKMTPSANLLLFGTREKRETSDNETMVIKYLSKEKSFIMKLEVCRGNVELQYWQPKTLVCLICMNHTLAKHNGSFFNYSSLHLFSAFALQIRFNISKYTQLYTQLSTASVSQLSRSFPSSTFILLKTLIIKTPTFKGKTTWAVLCRSYISCRFKRKN